MNALQPILSIFSTHRAGLGVKQNTPYTPLTFGSDKFVRSDILPHPIDPKMRPFENELTQRIYNSVEKPSGTELEQWCKQTGTTHLGVPTLDFINGIPTQAQVNQVFQDMEAIVNTIQSSNPREYAGNASINNRPVEITSIAPEDLGVNGYIYKVNINDKNYALKIFRKENDEDKHGTHPEISTGVYFTNKPTKDLSYMYFGDVKNGYAIYEWLDESTNLNKRPGKTLLEQGYYCNDDGQPHGEMQDCILINGVLFDHGDIQKLTDEARRLREWNLVSTHPKVKFRLTNYLSTFRKNRLPNDWLLQAYKTLLDKLPEYSHILAAHIECGPIELHKDMFNLAIHSNVFSRNKALKYTSKIFKKDELRKVLEPIFTQYEDSRDQINLILSQAHLEPLSVKE